MVIPQNNLYLCSMNKNLKIISVFLLVVVSFYTSSLATKSLYYPDFQDYPISLQEQVIEDFSTTPLYHSQENHHPTESLVKLLNFKLKAHSNLIGIIVHATEQYFNTELLLNIDFTKNILINYRKTDLIYPFHYFW